MWENNEFRIKLRENSIMEYEKIMLSSGQCDFFMPMGFMGEEGGETVCYDCSGFVPLSGYRIEKTEDALYLLERTLIILGKSVEYLISPYRITLNTDTVFYNKDTGQVKIAYVPNPEDKTSLRKNLVAFIGQLKEDIRDGREDYLTQTAKCIYYKNYYIKDVITQVALYKRKLYMQDMVVN